LFWCICARYTLSISILLYIFFPFPSLFLCACVRGTKF